MNIKDDLGLRMKNNYEKISQTKLLRRTPVILRIDGKAFHTFTRGFGKPFDFVLIRSMQDTMKYLCENIQGCVFGYTQSDEITLVLTDYKKLNSAAWFDYEVQKLCSIGASMATMAFNYFFQVRLMNTKDPNTWDQTPYWTMDPPDKCEYGFFKQAMFDCRCFNIPKEEVCNLIYWRQADASRNSIQMVGHTFFSHKELQGLTCSQIQDKLMLEKNINWNDFYTCYKRGSACFKDDDKWVIDTEMPILVNEDRNYVEKHIYCEEK